MVCFIVEGKKETVKRLLLLNHFFEQLNCLHLRMFLLLFVGDPDGWGFVRWLVVQSIKRELLLLEKGDISFKTGAVHGEVAMKVEFLHDLFSQFEDSVISGQGYYFLLSFHDDDDIDVAVEVYICFYCLSFYHLEEKIYCFQTYLRVLFCLLHYLQETHLPGVCLHVYVFFIFWTEKYLDYLFDDFIDMRRRDHF